MRWVAYIQKASSSRTWSKQPSISMKCINSVLAKSDDLTPNSVGLESLQCLLKGFAFLKRFVVGMTLLWTARVRRFPQKTPDIYPGIYPDKAIN